MADPPLDAQAPLARAALALSSGDPVRALGALGTRSDAHALLLRGIALAQLDELDGAARALDAAIAALEGHATQRARARAMAARVEVALARRELTRAGTWIARAIAALEGVSDRDNADYLRAIDARRAILVGDLEHARARLAERRPRTPLARAIGALAEAELALRSGRAAAAARALARARSGVPALDGEAAALERSLDEPIARVGGVEVGARALERARARRGALVVDACRRTVSRDAQVVDLATRPVLFALIEALATGIEDRDEIVRAAFGASRPNATHRARLRVEIGRARRAIASVVSIETTARGYRLEPIEIVHVRPAIAGPAGAVSALLSDGRAWAARDVALALALPLRTVQRALEEVALRSGDARRARWVLRRPAIAPPLLLLGLATERYVPLVQVIEGGGER